MSKFLKIMFSISFLSLLVGVATIPAQAADTYQVDPSHSSLEFAAKHLMVSTVKGGFTDFTGSIQYDPADATAFNAEVTIQAASLSTNQKQRDEHLRGNDFFDVEKFPTLTFKSKSLAKSGDGYQLIGDLNMHGVTKEISIPVQISGPVASPFGTQVIGISGTTKINRQDFGIAWNKSLDNGGLVVADDVDLMVNIEASHK